MKTAILVNLFLERLFSAVLSFIEVRCTSSYKAEALCHYCADFFWKKLCVFFLMNEKFHLKMPLGAVSQHP